MAKQDHSADRKKLKESLQAFLDGVQKLKALPPKNREFGRIESGLKFDLKKAGFDEDTPEWELVFPESLPVTGFFRDPVKQAEYEKKEYHQAIEALEDGASELLKRLPD